MWVDVLKINAQRLSEAPRHKSSHLLRQVSFVICESRRHFPLMTTCPDDYFTSFQKTFSSSNLNCLSIASYQLGSARAFVALPGRQLESTNHSEVPKNWGPLRVLPEHLVVVCWIKSSTGAVLSVTLGVPSSGFMISSDSPIGLHHWDESSCSLSSWLTAEPRWYGN